jgi:AraC-like DNA-binding protein
VGLRSDNWTAVTITLNQFACFDWRRRGPEHDGVYRRNFKIVCFAVGDKVFAKHIRRFSPQLMDAVRQPWSLFEPPPASRREIIAHFAEAAAIIQSDPRVRNSSQALAKFEEELVCDFLEAVGQQFPSHSIGTDQRAAAMLQRVDQVVKKSRLVDPTVAELCAACEVPRRTLNRAFQNALGMGPATSLRRVRLNRARRALQARTRSTRVSGVAFRLGFWNLGRFERAFRIYTIHNAKRIKGNAMPMQHLRCGKRLVKRRLVSGWQDNLFRFRTWWILVYLGDSFRSGRR